MEAPGRGGGPCFVALSSARSVVRVGRKGAWICCAETAASGEIAVESGGAAAAAATTVPLISDVSRVGHRPTRPRKGTRANLPATYGASSVKPESRVSGIFDEPEPTREEQVRMKESVEMVQERKKREEVVRSAASAKAAADSTSAAGGRSTRAGPFPKESSVASEPGTRSGGYASLPSEQESGDDAQTQYFGYESEAVPIGELFGSAPAKARQGPGKAAKAQPAQAQANEEVDLPTGREGPLLTPQENAELDAFAKNELRKLRLSERKRITALDLIRSQERSEFLKREEARQRRAQQREERNQLYEARRRLRQLREEMRRSEYEARADARKMRDEIYSDVAEEAAKQAANPSDGQAESGSFVRMKDLDRMVRAEINTSQKSAGPSKEQLDKIRSLQEELRREESRLAAEVENEGGKDEDDVAATRVMRDRYYDPDFNFGESRRSALAAKMLTNPNANDGIEDAAKRERERAAAGFDYFNGTVYMPNEKFDDFDREFDRDFESGPARRREPSPFGKNNARDDKAGSAHPRANTEVEMLLDELDSESSGDEEGMSERSGGGWDRGAPRDEQQTRFGGRGGGSFRESNRRGGNFRASRGRGGWSEGSRDQYNRAPARSRGNSEGRRFGGRPRYSSSNRQDGGDFGGGYADDGGYAPRRYGPSREGSGRRWAPRGRGRYSEYRGSRGQS